MQVYIVFFKDASCIRVSGVTVLLSDGQTFAECRVTQLPSDPILCTRTARTRPRPCARRGAAGGAWRAVPAASPPACGTSSCDGAAQCPGGEDEAAMEASDGLVVRCGGGAGQPWGAGQPCRRYTARHPGASYTEGVSCGDGECLRKVIF